jgi:hypothetical protein
MPDFILSHTDNPPAKITGEQIGIARSSNAAPIPGELPPGGRQAFWIVLYRLASAKIVAHVMYRAGAQLGREEPVDDIIVGTDAADLLAKLATLDGADYVSGWPEFGEPAVNRGRDYRSQHESVMRHGRKQLTEAVRDAQRLLRVDPAPVEIV